MTGKQVSGYDIVTGAYRDWEKGIVTGKHGSVLVMGLLGDIGGAIGGIVTGKHRDWETS